MKLLSLTHVAVLTSAVALAGLGRAVADDTDTNNAPADGHHWHHDSVLTSDEWAELKKDHEQVFTSNPDLKTEGESLHQEGKALHDNTSATPEDKQAFREKWHAYHDKVDAAIEAIDPNASALIDKLKAAHHHHDGGDAGGTSNQ